MCKQADQGAENIDGLVQDCSISSALAMEILQSCTKPSTYQFNKIFPISFRITSQSLRQSYSSPINTAATLKNMGIFQSIIKKFD